MLDTRDACAMTPTVSHIPVTSLSCAGCDCGSCASDAAAAIASMDGVLHVRVDRRTRSFVIRHDATVADATSLHERIAAAKIRIA